MAGVDIGPYNVAHEVIKSDTVNFPRYRHEVQNGLTDALYVGGAGIVVAVYCDDSIAAFTCLAGQLLPIAIKRVNSTNTTATLMVALYRA